MDDGIEITDVKNRYSRIETIWSKSDIWHYKTSIIIRNYIEKASTQYRFKKQQMLNLGSGGNSYGFNDNMMLHVDIVDKLIKSKPYHLVANIENLIEISDQVHDEILCVGSVINYCDPFYVIKECSRVIQNKGFLILEFECSKSFEYILSDSYNKKNAKVSTFYQNKEETIFIYSENYIKEILEAYNFCILETTRFHLISPLIYRLSENSNLASNFLGIDKYVRRIPFIGTNASNVILLAQKLTPPK